MFSSKRQNSETVISDGLKVEGNVTAEGLVEVHGKIYGDMHCTSIVICNNAEIKGTVVADDVVVDGLVEGPIRCKDVLLKSKARVKGSIHHQSLTIEKGAQFEGEVIPGHGTEKDTPAANGKLKAQAANGEAKTPAPASAAE